VAEGQDRIPVVLMATVPLLVMRFAMGFLRFQNRRKRGVRQFRRVLLEGGMPPPQAARLALALAVVMVPVAFTILARVSRVAHPFRLVLLVSPLAVAGYLAAGSLIRDPTSSLVLSFGVAGAFVFRADPPQRIPLRITVVGVASVLVVLFAIVAYEAALLLAPFVPFPALMVADRIAAARPADAVPG